jgi:hypothetical protein
MPRRDKFHEACKQALIKDGWTITQDPLMIEWGKKDLYVDLGVERLLAAEKGTEKIALKILAFEPSTAEVKQWIHTELS